MIVCSTKRPLLSNVSDVHWHGYWLFRSLPEPMPVRSDGTFFHAQYPLDFFAVQSHLLKNQKCFETKGQRLVGTAYFVILLAEAVDIEMYEIPLVVCCELCGFPTILDDFIYFLAASKFFG